MSDSSPESNANAELMEFARSVLGSGITLEDRTRDIGRRSVIWRIGMDDGGWAWLKSHNDEWQYVRETRALGEWVPALGEQSWWRTPELIAKSDELEAIVISEIKGGILDDTAVSGDKRRRMFELAGRFIRLLHDAAVDSEESVDPAVDIVAARDRYIPPAEPYLDAETVEWTREVIGEGEDFADARVVAAHMDYSPRNWLIDRQEDGIGFGLIDWERSRHSIWLQDAQRMAYDHWLEAPELREAFFAGYGREPTAAEERQMQLLTLVNSIGAVPYAIRMGDDHFLQLSRGVIERLKKEIR